MELSDQANMTSAKTRDPNDTRWSGAGAAKQAEARLRNAEATLENSRQSPDDDSDTDHRRAAGQVTDTPRQTEKFSMKNHLGEYLSSTSGTSPVCLVTPIR